MQLDGRALTLVPLSAAHADDLIRIRRTPEVRARWGDLDDDPGFPFEEPESPRFAVVEAGRVVGMIQYAEELTPQYRHAGIDLFLDPAVHGRGVGRDAVRTLARYLIDDRGHHRLVIDPSADNDAAIRCYAAVGFRPVGVMRGYERDVDGRGWHDGLLMDLLAADLID